MDKAYSSRIHSREARKEISEKYNSTVDLVNKSLADMQGTMRYMQGYLKPAASANEYKADAVSKEAIHNLQGLSQNFANIHTPLYGDNTEPCHLSMANFLDQYDVATNPNKVIKMIGSGNSSTLQTAMFKTMYPSMWNDYVSGASINTYQNNVSPQQRALLYGTTGMETSPVFSKANMEMQLQQQAMQHNSSQPSPNTQILPQSQQGEKPTRKLSASTIENNPYFAPATSDRGKGP